MSAGNGPGVSSAETGAVVQKTEVAPKQPTQAELRQEAIQKGLNQRTEIEARQDAINMRSIIDNRNPPDSQADLRDLANKDSLQLAKEAAELTQKQPELNLQPASTVEQPLTGPINNPATETRKPQEPQTGTSTESKPADAGMTPPEATGVSTEQAEPTADEKTNNVARELLEKDETAKAYLKTLGITDLENLNVAEEIERLKGKETAGTLTKGEGPLLRRLQEIHGRALRQEAQVKLDEMNKNGEDKNSPAYQEAKQQFEDHAPDEERHYVREAIRQDTGLRKMVQKKYDLEDFDIQQAIHDEGDSRLGKRLQEISDHGHRAVLLDKQEYTKSEDQAGLMNEIAKTGEHERGFGRRGLDKLNDFIEQFSGAEIRNAFNQAKGWKTVMKSNEKLLKNPNLSEDDRKRYKENLENAKKLRAAALNEALGKRGLKILFWIFIALSALMVIGPAVLPAKLMEWGGKGAGGH